MGLVIDCFAGGGGASTGIEAALGKPCDIAVNHDPKAIAMHRANHPKTHHVTEDIFEADLRCLVGDEPVDVMWASPDCTSHSRAKGGAPRLSGLRMLPWAVHKHAAELRPNVIFMENVAEIQKWGPLGADGRPIKAREGEEYNRFVDAMGELGYTFECRELAACDFGAPTTRCRWYAVLRRDGRPVRWPEVTHGDGLFYEPYVPAAACIDFSDTGESIFERKRPLAEATMRRIARGLKRFVLDDPSPFLVQIGYGERPGQKPRVGSVHEPLGTVVAQGVKHYLCTPFVTRFNENATGQRVDAPLQTITTGGSGPFGLMSCFLQKHYTGVTGQSLREPMHTVTAGFNSHFSLMSCHLTKFYGCGTGQSLLEPMHTVTSSPGHFGLVSAFLVKYYGTAVGQHLAQPLGTVTSKDRFGLVTVEIDGQTYAISDIRLRMLRPEELKRAQGFPADYIIDKYDDGRPVPVAQQVKMIGNSVVPLMAERLVAANVGGAE
ncbi:MAG: DNA cytosine methyltransferase [Adlercreutzia sp.]|nr:DNA cytosine methyltransferase [Adlercreutzia sp.]